MLTTAKTIEPQRPQAAEASGIGRILMRVFETLENAGIPYCVLHGYDDLPALMKSDVDCIIGDGVSARDLLKLFDREHEYIGAQVVCCHGHYLVFAGRNVDGSPSFLALDFSINCDVNDLPLYNGNEILETRRRHGHFYIPAADLEFGAYLTRSITKNAFGEDRAGRLNNAFRQDPLGCAAQVARHLSGTNAQLVLMAAQSGNWTPVRKRLKGLQSEMRWRAIRRRPRRFIANKWRGLTGPIRRILWPQGLCVALLGPDGAGKSSVIDSLGPTLQPICPRWTCLGFAPGLLGFLRRGNRSTNRPHGLPPRSLPVSLLRLAYWFAYHMLSFIPRRLALARSTLVLHDRHFVDILIDQRRYRYGGSVGLLRLLWLIIPKPDLIILLDAAPEILQARKQEVPFDVTARQRHSYLALVRTLSIGRIVNAGQPRTCVANDTSEIILQYAADRMLRRHRLSRP